MERQKFQSRNTRSRLRVDMNNIYTMNNHTNLVFPVQSVEKKLLLSLSLLES